MKMKRIKKLLLTGYIGNHNLGDDLMMRQVINYIEKKHPETEISVLIRYSGAKHGYDFGSDVKVINLHNLRLTKIKLLAYSRLIRKFDLVIWTGGTCFGDGSFDNLYRYFETNMKKQVKYGFMSVGIDYLKDPVTKRRVADILRKSEFLSFRDSSSYECACELLGDDTISTARKPEQQIVQNTEQHTGQVNGGIIQTSDLVYGYLSDHFRGNLSVPKDNRLLVSARYMSQYMTDTEETCLYDKLADCIKEISTDYDEVVFLPIDEYMDQTVNRQLADRLRDECRGTVVTPHASANVKYIPHMDMDEKADLIASSKAYICGRLHGMLIGEWTGVNVAALSYSLKTRIFLEDIGREADCVDCRSFTKEQLLSALSQGPMEDKKSTCIEDFRNLADASLTAFKQLDEVLSDGTPVNEQ